MIFDPDRRHVRPEIDPTSPEPRLVVKRIEICLDDGQWWSLAKLRTAIPSKVVAQRLRDLIYADQYKDPLTQKWPRPERERKYEIRTIRRRGASPWIEIRKKPASGSQATLFTLPTQTRL